MTSTGSVDLTWTDHADDEAGFVIERTTDGVSFVQIARLSANVNRHLDGTTNLMSVCSYRVAAYNSAGQSPYSNVATARATPGGDDGGGHRGKGGGTADAWLVIAGLVLVLAHRKTPSERPLRRDSAR
jgi:hypothetical protein